MKHVGGFVKTFVALVLFSGPAFAWAAGITYHGRLLKPDGTVVNANPVKFKIELRSPGSENCLMYSETHAIDMSDSEGVFAITINDGTATVVNTEPFTLDRVFQNRGTFTFGGAKCSIGNTYVPNTGDGRKMVVSFDDGFTGGWEPLPSQAINHVPMSLESLTVGGYGAGSMLRVHDGTGAPASISALTQTQYNTFVDLLAGTSSLYLTSLSGLNGANLTAGSVDDTKLASGITGTKISGNITGNAAGFTGSLNGDVTGTQSATVVGKIQGRAVDSTAPSNGQVLKWNSGASRWEPGTVSAGGGGTVTSVTGTGSVVMTGTATDPIVGVQDASSSQKGVVQLATSGQNAANVVVQGNDSRLSDARTPTAHHHNVDEIDSAVGKYFLYKPNNAQCGDGQVLKWINANQRWECANDAGAAGTVASLTANSPIVKTGTSSDPIITVQDASTSQKGAVQLASSSDTTAGLAIQANDTRLTDARAPTAHHHNVDEIDSAAAKYFGYKPNNAACANNEILKWDNSNSRWICATAGSLVNAESTTASNVGTAGVGVFKQLSTYDLQLKKLNPAGAVTITDDTGNSKIDIGLNLGGVFTNNTGLIVSDGTQLLNKACSANQVLKWLSPTGWTCAADDGLTSETDPKVGSNTLNYLSKWSGSALVTSGVYENSGSVGIGTSSPAAKLNVVGGDLRVDGTAVSYSSLISGTGDTYIRGGTAASKVVIGDQNTGKIEMTGPGDKVISGKVGIGTSTPQYPLQVVETAQVNMRGLVSSQFSDTTHSGIFIGTKARGTPAAPTIVQGGDSLSSLCAAGYDGSQYLRQGCAGFAAVGTPALNDIATAFTISTSPVAGGPAERFRIDQNGNVGIGSASPAARLDISLSNPSNAGALGAIRTLAEHAPTAANTVDTWGINSTVQYNSTFSGQRVLGGHIQAKNMSSGNLVEVMGVAGAADNTGTGTVGAATGVYGRVMNTSTGTITNAKGVYAIVANSGGGTVSTGYGVYIDAIQATTKWSLYSADGSPSYFAGNVGIGTTNTTAKLVIGGTAGVDGIKFPDGTLQTTASTGGGGSGPTTMVVLTSGTSWTVPAGVTKIKVTVTGGGGSGSGPSGNDGYGGCYNAQGAYAGAGAGGTSIGFVTVTPGASISYSIGAGGAAVTGACANGNAGGTTTFNSSPVLSATGGARGNGGVTITPSPGCGGTGSGGQFNTTGGCGSGSYLGSYASGGASYFGGGGMTNVAGQAYGSGGGGKGAGGAGVIVIEY